MELLLSRLTIKTASRKLSSLNPPLSLLPTVLGCTVSGQGLKNLDRFRLRLGIVMPDRDGRSGHEPPQRRAVKGGNVSVTLPWPCCGGAEKWHGRWLQGLPKFPQKVFDFERVGRLDQMSVEP